MGETADNPLWDEIESVEVRTSRRKLFVQVVLPWCLVAPATTFLVARLFLPAPLPLAIAGAVGLAIAALPFAFRQQLLLRIDRDGIDHAQLGRIPWKRIDGIGVFESAGRRPIQGGMLSFHLADHPRMDDRVGRASRFLCRELERWQRISVPLRFTDGDALKAYTAATRFRSAFEPPAISGLNLGLAKDSFAPPGNASALAAIDHIEDPASRALYDGWQRRMDHFRDLMQSAMGGWTSDDGPETIRLRLERAKLLVANEAEHRAFFNGIVEPLQRDDRALSVSRMQAASDQAGAQAKATPTGRRLEEIDRLLNPEPKKPDWRGSALILIVFLGFPPLLIWLAMHFHH